MFQIRLVSITLFAWVRRSIQFSKTISLFMPGKSLPNLWISLFQNIKTSYTLQHSRFHNQNFDNICISYTTSTPKTSAQHLPAVFIFISKQRLIKKCYSNTISMVNKLQTTSMLLAGYRNILNCATTYLGNEWSKILLDKCIRYSKINCVQCRVQLTTMNIKSRPTETQFDFAHTFTERLLLSYIDSNESDIRKCQQFEQTRRYLGHFGNMKNVTFCQRGTELYDGRFSRTRLEIEGPFHVETQRKNVGM